LEFIENSSKLIKPVSICELDLSSLVMNMKMCILLEYLILQLIIEKRAHVNMWDFYNDFKCHEMDDAKHYCVLVEKHE